MVLSPKGDLSFCNFTLAKNNFLAIIQITGAVLPHNRERTFGTALIFYYFRLIWPWIVPISNIAKFCSLPRSFCSLVEQVFRSS